MIIKINTKAFYAFIMTLPILIIVIGIDAYNIYINRITVSLIILNIITIFYPIFKIKDEFEKIGGFGNYIIEITSECLTKEKKGNKTYFEWQDFYSVIKFHNRIYLYLKRKNSIRSYRRLIYLDRKDFSSKDEFDACFENCNTYIKKQSIKI
ncbi:YcxB family protein [Snodgrassella sp. M0351]|uniref:YcxB family protein n=1 Tax=Snodgrassella sp. M0351 TaxID=2751012 RepID=UPI0018DE20F1|nr:YcxB family protein [Snodgrassella sp. M0351]MBI0165430.1 YcxB family protein [Snodgrassella sp. M0351]